MPNWCNNTVIFSGDKENLDKLTSALNAAKKLDDETREAQIIHGLGEVVEGYFFSIYYERLDNEIYFQYETRWSPNIDDVSQLCKEFKVSAEHEYSEPGCRIYGTATYDWSALNQQHIYHDQFLFKLENSLTARPNGCYSVNQIEEEFLDLIEYDIDSDRYIYEGEYWDSEMEIIYFEYQNWKEKNF